MYSINTKWHLCAFDLTRLNAVPLLYKERKKISRARHGNVESHSAFEHTRKNCAGKMEKNRRRPKGIKHSFAFKGGNAGNPNLSFPTIRKKKQQRIDCRNLSQFSFVWHFKWGTNKINSTRHGCLKWRIGEGGWKGRGIRTLRHFCFFVCKQRCTKDTIWPARRISIQITTFHTPTPQPQTSSLFS